LVSLPAVVAITGLVAATVGSMFHPTKMIDGRPD